MITFILGNIFNYLVLIIGVTSLFFGIILTIVYFEGYDESILVIIMLCFFYMVFYFLFSYSCNYGLLVDECNLKTKLIRLFNSL